MKRKKETKEKRRVKLGWLRREEKDKERKKRETQVQKGKE
jgi:hypothetical protein